MNRKSLYKYLPILIIILVLSPELTGQESKLNTKKHISLKTEFLQLKEGLNYGLVFNGVNFSGSYSVEKDFNKTSLVIVHELSFGVNYNKGLGLTWGYVPINIFYGWNLKKYETKNISIGPYFTTNYNVQLYPELQSGHMFWYTSIEIGPQIRFTLPILNNQFKISIANSLAGITSRPEDGTETYYYSLKFSDFITNPHRNLKFGSFNQFNHTNIKIERQNLGSRKLSLAYEFEYFGYYEEPKLRSLSHSLNLIWKIGKQ